MNDPLAQFRKTPLASKSVAPPKGPEEYVAFAGKDRVDRLQIRRANSQTHSPGYGVLLNVSYDGPFGTNFVLTYSFLMMVYVEGKNLQPVISAIEKSLAEYIQEFDPDRWELPKDASAPVIETITVVMQEGGPPMPETDNSGEGKSRPNLH